MKEESRKIMAAKNDEILSSLFDSSIKDFDSISSIKDDSLVDIDLSACVTISACISSNIGSISSSDFWRVLDESAQNPQLDITTSNDESMTIYNLAHGTEKTVESSSFRGTFLRPEPPAASISPLKNSSKHAAERQERKIKLPSSTNVGNKKPKTPTYLIKEEPLEENESKSLNLSNKSISPHSFKVFMLPTFISTKAQISNTMQDVGSPALTNTSNIPLFKCLDCNGLLLKGNKEYTAHDLASHRIVYKCTVCDREFEQESDMKKHLKTHRSKDAWKKCPDCGKCLKLGSMWMHRKIHTDNKKYGCEICGQKFVQKINLTHHSRVHTAEKPFECPECQKRFQERSHLQRHQKYHSTTRSYRCEKCGKMYKTERCLKVHNLVHLEQRPFACNVCDKSFISNSKLKQHSNIHTGERPFKCNYCPRDFTNFPNWLKHTRRRHKVDHKTGEHLENIPSYCSKKSSKTAKPLKSLAVPTCVAELTPISTEVGSELIASQKSQVRRKKKEESLEELGNRLSSVQSIKIASTASIKKEAKIKRERKQLTPKQVQKSPPLPIIKKELNEARHNFPDLHCLSITSAEELIMEQALEMEECGLYVTPVGVVNTDNAMSIETHFDIKSEFTANRVKEEEFISLRDEKNSNFCSSIESSPYSSPASMERAPSATVTVSSYVPGISQPDILKSQAVRQDKEVTPPTIFNQIYMPMQPNQALPSVSTLLFSTHSTSGHFQGQGVRPQHKLT